METNRSKDKRYKDMTGYNRENAKNAKEKSHQFIFYCGSCYDSVSNGCYLAFFEILCKIDKIKCFVYCPIGPYLPCFTF